MRNIDVQYHPGQRHATAPGLYQYDRGVELTITGMSFAVLPEMQFGIDGYQNTITAIPSVEDNKVKVQIPDVVQTQPRGVVCYVYIDSGSQGTTIFEIRIPVFPRHKPSDYVFTDDQTESITNLLSKLNESISEADDLVVKFEQDAENMMTSLDFASSIRLPQNGSLVVVNDAAPRCVDQLQTIVDPDTTGTGYTSFTLTRTGKNIFGSEALAQSIIDQVSGATIDSGNKTVTYAASKISGITLFDRFLPDTQYTIIFNVASATGKRLNLRVHYTDGTSTLVDTPDGGAGVITLVTEVGKSVAAITGSNQGGTVTLNYDLCGVFEGDIDASEFVPYEGMVLLAEMPEPFYGGKLDWLTGVASGTYASDGTVLDTPVISQFNAQPLELLMGYNAIWSSHGNIDLIYVVDTQAYIDAYVGQGGGAIKSVNGKTGAVILSASDVGALPSDAEIIDATARSQIEIMAEDIDNLKNTEGPDVQTVADNLAAEKLRAENAESGLDSRISIVEQDYLKSSDKKELQDQIDANEEAISLLTNGVDSETVDGVNDLIKYVNEHGTEVTAMKAEIEANTEAIVTETKRIDMLSTYVTPQMFGAKGDGETDDTAAMQAAFNDVAVNGKYLFIPRGKYKVTSPITVDWSSTSATKRNFLQKIIGAGSQAFEKSYDNAVIIGHNIPENRAVIELVGDGNTWGTETRIEDLAIECDETSCNSMSFALKYGDARNVKFSRVKLRGHNGILARCGSIVDSEGNSITNGYEQINIKFEQCDIYTFSGGTKGFAFLPEGILTGHYATMDNILLDSCCISGVWVINSVNFMALSTHVCIPNVANKEVTTNNVGLLNGYEIDYATGFYVGQAMSCVLQNCYFEDFRRGIHITPSLGNVRNVNIMGSYLNPGCNQTNSDGSRLCADYGVLINSGMTDKVVRNVIIQSNVFRYVAGDTEYVVASVYNGFANHFVFRDNCTTATQEVQKLVNLTESGYDIQNGADSGASVKSMTTANDGRELTIELTNGKSVTARTGEPGQRGTGILKVTTAPSSYTTATGGYTPTYRIALSTVQSQAMVTEALVGDTQAYSYYQYPVGYVDASYVYLGARISVRGATGAAGTTPVKGTDYYTEAEQTQMISDVTAGLAKLTQIGTDADDVQHTWIIHGVAN